MSTYIVSKKKKKRRGYFPGMAMGSMGAKFPTFNFNYSLATFTAAMAKRNSAGPFAAGVLAQGKRDGTGTGDDITLQVGTAIAPSFYPNIDARQGSIVFWITPEWAGNDGVQHNISLDTGTGNANIQKTAGNLLSFSMGFTAITTDISAWVAGTTYCVVLRWNNSNTLDGTNYCCISINDAHVFGDTASGATSTINIYRLAYQSSGQLIKGFTIYRRCLWDGAYGVNAGNGDELNLIHAAGAGADPCTITGSWDVCLCVPTNSTVGALTTGTGDAWSMCHPSNLFTDGWLQSYYGNQWGVKFNGTSTYIDCGSGATLDDLCAGGATMQVEGWVRHDDQTASFSKIATKATVSAGWGLQITVSDFLNLNIDLATTDVSALSIGTMRDGKWHHVVGSYDDTTKTGMVALDGIWGAASVGAGAYVGDAASNLVFGRRSDGIQYFEGCLGWFNIYNNAFYTPGTNFKPPRTPTAADVEEWLLNEGTGTTLTAQVTSPANDGTITAGTWEPQWYAEGTPIVPTSVQGSASYRADVGSGATIDDLADNAFTVDGWFRVPKLSGLQYLCHKGTPDTNGWYLQLNSGQIFGLITCATTAAQSYSTARYDDGRWHYIKMTFDDAGDRKIDLFVDNVEVTYGTQTAGVGAITSDAAGNGSIGRSTGSSSLTGGHGWIRWSNVVRGAGMISRYAGPAVDGNTVAQWEATEGALAVLTDSSGNANHGAMAGTYSWVNTGAMDLDSPGARVYGWGDAVGSDAVNEGKKITYTGLTAGANYVLRALAYSEDGVGIPRVEVYDETNSAVITAITGLATSTEWTPDVLLFSFELPTNARGAAADCTSISIKRISTTAGNVGWHQLELYANLLDNPSLDTGAVADPWIPYGWTNALVDAGDTEIETVIRHSEGACIQANAGANAEYIFFTGASAIGKFIGVGCWRYSSAAATQVLFGASGFGRLVEQRTLSTDVSLAPSAGTAWVHAKTVGRATHASPYCVILFGNPGAVAERYIDDGYYIALDDVTLTIIPASAANSAEGSGIRVDGLDKAPQTTSGITLSKGKITFNVTPRHSAATVALLGNATPIVAYVHGDANNYINLDWSAANTLRLRYNASGGGVQTGTWDATGAIVAGTTYAMEIKYTGSAMTVSVDNVVKITITAACIFSTALATFYPGSDATPANQFDAVFG